MKNLYQIVHIIGAMQGLFIFVLLIIRKKNKQANKIFAAMILLFTIHLTTSFLHTNNDEINDLLATNRSDMFVLSYGPLIAFYILFLTGFCQKLRLKHYLQFLPSTVLLLMLGLSHTNFNELIPLWDGNNHVTLRVWILIHSLTLLHFLCYLVYGLTIAHKYKKQLSSFFSQSGAIYLKWLRIILYSYIAICIFALIQFFKNTFGDSEGILQWIISALGVLSVYLIGYLTIRQPDILQDLNAMKESLDYSEPDELNEANDDKKQARYEKNRLTQSEERKNLNLLIECVRDNKLYLEPKLSLKQLSEKVGIPSHQISMLLSIYLEQNFYDFINKYRIEEAKKRLIEDVNKTENILTIAFDIGFNSKSTFNAVFKKIEGVTPSEYRSKR